MLTFVLFVQMSETPRFELPDGTAESLDREFERQRLIEFVGGRIDELWAKQSLGVVKPENE